MPSLSTFVNIELIKQPYNWVIVWLMVAIAVLGITYLAQNATPPKV